MKEKVEEEKSERREVTTVLVMVVSLSKSIFTHTRFEEAPRLRGHSKFSTVLGITFEIDVARPRNFGLFKLFDFSHLTRGLLPLAFALSFCFSSSILERT